MMISDKKRLQIANICYANVAGQFASFCNVKNRGPNFTWERFIQNCEEDAETWMSIYSVRGDRRLIRYTAREYAKEIATNLVNKVTDNG